MPDHKYLETPSMVDQCHALPGYIYSFKLVETNGRKFQSTTPVQIISSQDVWARYGQVQNDLYECRSHQNPGVFDRLLLHNGEAILESLFLLWPLQRRE